MIPRGAGNTPKCLRLSFTLEFWAKGTDRIVPETEWSRRSVGRVRRENRRKAKVYHFLPTLFCSHSSHTLLTRGKVPLSRVSSLLPWLTTADTPPNNSFISVFRYCTAYTSVLCVCCASKRGSPNTTPHYLGRSHPEWYPEPYVIRSLVICLSHITLHNGTDPRLGRVQCRVSIP